MLAQLSYQRENMTTCQGYCDDCSQACSTADDAQEIERLHRIIAAIGEALGDLIGEVPYPDDYIDGPAGGRVPQSWGTALRVHDEIYGEWLDTEGD